jgi:hypothetical protein
MVTFVSVDLRSKSLLKKKFIIISKKKPQTPQKWRPIKMKTVPWESKWSKPSTGKLQSPSINNKENHFFASVAQICLPFFVFFSSFFNRSSGLPQHHRGILNGSLKSYF